jgi:hypothetical protein
MMAKQSRYPEEGVKQGMGIVVCVGQPLGNPLVKFDEDALEDSSTSFMSAIL